MAQENHPVRVDQIDWASALPFASMFRSFRMAIHPPKLLLALVLVVLLYLFGCVLDFAFGSRVYSGELQAYAERSTERFDRWLENRENVVFDELDAALGFLSVDQKKEYTKLMRLRAKKPSDAPSLDRVLEAAKSDVSEHYRRIIYEQPDAESGLRVQRADRIGQIKALRLRGIFEAALKFKIEAFRRLVQSASSFQFGLTNLASGTHDNQTVVGALRDLVIVLPGWMFGRHLAFMCVWMLGAMALWALLGGAICRMAALQATRDESMAVTDALAFARGRWVWFFLAPLIPLILVLLVALVMAVGGLLFNWYVTDIVAAVLFGLWLVGGLVIALILIGLTGGANLLYPAIAVEGTDAFDAISRTFHYVFFRPWQLVFYNLVALIYGAITYLFVGLVVFLVMSVVHRFTGVWVTEALPGARTHFDAILPRPQIDQLAYEVDWSRLDASAKVAAALVYVWSLLLVVMVAAYAISFYCSVNTWIYLLLRRAADGEDFDMVITDASPDELVSDAAALVPDKVEPADQSEPTT